MEQYGKAQSPERIYLALGRSKAWFYKWLARYNLDDPTWYRDSSRRPFNHSQKTAWEIEEIVRVTRLSLYNQGVFCGAQAILWELEEQCSHPLPSLRTINRILHRQDLTHRRTRRYEPKGTKYPALPAKGPNARHQADFVGPRYLRGANGTLRFYSMNVVDLSTGRCGTQPLFSRSGTAVYEAFWAIWSRLGLPRHLQVDNEMVFYGSPTHPRGMGPLVRLCLHYGIELWFIPQSEPWRNGVVEQFNHHYQQKFLRRVSMRTEEELQAGALAFEQTHNSRYRYSKLSGKTPLQALALSGNAPLQFPPDHPPPTPPLTRPESGCYNLIRFIRSDCTLDIFGERFRVSPALQYEYVVATIDVKEQKLKLFHDHSQVDEFDYTLR